MMTTPRALQLVIVLAAISSAGCERLSANRARDYFSDPGVVALAEAAGNGDVRRIRRISRTGTDVNAMGRDGITPLGWAMLKRNLRGFEELLKLGADPNLGPDDRAGIMHLVAGVADSRWLTSALRNGGDPNRLGELGRTPIFYAVLAGNEQNLLLLARNGADLNHQDSMGNTALLEAGLSNQFDIALRLLEEGADPSLENNLGMTIVDPIRESTVDPNSEQYEWQGKVTEFLSRRSSDS